MNYQKIYNDIITNAQSECRFKSKENYYEEHHIYPKSFGGGDEQSNLVLLTSREHYICHYLLVKFNTSMEKSKMALAFNMMNSNGNDRQSRYYNSKLYESNKKNLPRGKVHHWYGKTHSDETKQKLREINLGKKHTQETKDKIRKLKTGLKSSQETKLKISKANKGKIIPQYQRDIISKSKLGKNNHNYIGNYITPWGTFESSTQASKGTEIAHKTIQNWCKNNNDKLINNRMISQSPYLKSLNISPLGKSFNEMGFDFRLS